MAAKGLLCRLAGGPLPFGGVLSAQIPCHPTRKVETTPPGR